MKEVYGPSLTFFNLHTLLICKVCYNMSFNVSLMSSRSLGALRYLTVILNNLALTFIVIGADPSWRPRGNQLDRKKPHRFP